MCNLPDYTDNTVIHQFTTCNLLVYERPLAEDTATFFILPVFIETPHAIFNISKVMFGLLKERPILGDHAKAHIHEIQWISHEIWQITHEIQ